MQEVKLILFHVVRTITKLIQYLTVRLITMMLLSNVKVRATVHIAMA